MSDAANGQQGGEPPAAAAAADAAAAAAPKKSVRVSFKVSGGSQFTLDVEEDWTVRTLKEKCQQNTDIPVAAQRLIYKGRILKDDDLISSQGIKDGHIMHLVKSVAAAAATNTPQQQQPQQQQQQQQQAAAAATNPPPAASTGVAPGTATMDPFLQSMLSGGLGGAGGMGPMPDGMGGPMGFPMGGPEMSQMMRSPFFQQAMDSLLQNPQMFRNIVESVPALRPMLPMMQGILDNPMRMRAMFNPQMMQASMQMHQAMQQMQQQQQQGGGDAAAAGGAPGAPPGAAALFAALQGASAGGAPAAVGAPAAGGAPGGPTGAPSSGMEGSGGAPGSLGSLGSGNMAFSSMMQQVEEMMRQNPELMSQMMQAFMGGGAPGGGAPGATPNPMGSFGSFGSLGGMGGPFPGAAQNTRPPEERFASQLQSLTDMGFIDRDANIAALQETDGDVNAAITLLLERGLGN